MTCPHCRSRGRGEIPVLPTDPIAVYRGHPVTVCEPSLAEIAHREFDRNFGMARPHLAWRVTRRHREAVVAPYRRS